MFGIAGSATNLRVAHLSQNARRTPDFPHAAPAMAALSGFLRRNSPESLEGHTFTGCGKMLCKRGTAFAEPHRARTEEALEGM
jgi:hypothetical protein